MTQETLVLTHRVHPQVLEALAPHAHLIPNQTDSSLPREELLDRLAQATGVVVFPPDVVDEEFLAHAPLLRVVSGAFMGSDNVNVRQCAARGVTCTNVPDLLAEPTAELAVTLLLGLARHVREGDRRVRAGGYRGWSPTLYGLGLNGATVGILGAGKVGLATARRLQGFGAELVYADPAPLDPELDSELGLRRMMLDAMLERCDAVVVATTLTPETRRLLDRSRLGQMKPGALLVNVGRGSVVDESAIAQLIAADHLGGYAADVFAFEDDGAENADGTTTIPAELLALEERTLFTSHLGSSVDEVRSAIEMRAAENAVLLLRGDHVVDVLEPRPQLASGVGAYPRRNK